MNSYRGRRPGRRWPPWLLFCSMASVAIGGASFFTAGFERAIIVPAGPAAALAVLEKAAPEPAGTSQEFSLSPLRPGAAARSAEKSHPSGLKKDLLCAPPDPGSASSRLDRCTEFTKPDSLCIRLMGTPKNHRSPPA